MLCLTIHREHGIQVGNGRVVLLEVKGSNAVRLGFEFPKEVIIVREDAVNKSRRTQDEDNTC